MITEEQAYAAMYHFLDQYYQQTKSDDVGALLGSMSLLNGEPVDSAISGDWEDAIEFALAGGKAGDLVLTPPDKLGS